MRALLAFVFLSASAFAARNFNGTSQYISCGNPSFLTGTSYTVAAWAKPTADTQQLIAWRSTSSLAPITLQLDLASGTGRFIVRDNANTIANSQKASAYSSGVWTHFLGTRSGNTTTVYINGVAGTPATASLGTITPDTLDIGAFRGGSTTPSGFWAGAIAEVAIWNAVLDTGEISALAKGMSPILVRPSKLVFWAPLIRGVTDRRNGTSLVDNGPSTVTDHVRIYR